MAGEPETNERTTHQFILCDPGTTAPLREPLFDIQQKKTLEGVSFEGNPVGNIKVEG